MHAKDTTELAYSLLAIRALNVLAGLAIFCDGTSAFRSGGDLRGGGMGKLLGITLSRPN